MTGVQEPPSQYVVPEQDRLYVACSEMPELIPIIELSSLTAPGNSPDDEAVKMQYALENWGLFPLSLS